MTNEERALFELRWSQRMEVEMDMSYARLMLKKEEEHKKKLDDKCKQQEELISTLEDKIWCLNDIISRNFYDLWRADDDEERIQRGF